jgi:hypothetical protein
MLVRGNPRHGPQPLKRDDDASSRLALAPSLCWVARGGCINLGGAPHLYRRVGQLATCQTVLKSDAPHSQDCSSTIIFDRESKFRLLCAVHDIVSRAPTSRASVRSLRDPGDVPWWQWCPPRNRGIMGHGRPHERGRQ